MQHGIDLTCLPLRCYASSFHILSVFYNKTMTGRLPLIAIYRGKNVKTPANRSSAFFKLETPLHSEKEFDDDDVISSSS